jgi:hypothetical protein
MIITTKRGIKVAKVEEVKNRKIGDEGRWNEIVIAIVYAAMKSALKYSEIYSAILSDEILIVVTFLLFLSISQARVIKAPCILHTRSHNR